MNKFERQRQRLEREYENELEELSRNRPNLSSTEYWSAYGDIVSKYTELVNDIDSQQRTYESLRAAKNSPKTPERPESTYADVVGQLKAAKLNELISELSSIPTQAIEDVDINDPFYLDKKEPLAVFEKWWNNELSELPSVAELQDFLSRIHINKNGYITYDSESISSTDSKDFDDVELIDPQYLKTSAQRKKEKAAKEVHRLRSRMPLLAKQDANKYKKELKTLSNSGANNERLNSLIGVIDAYDLPVELSDLLYTHAEKVCIPKGMLRAEQYQPMIEQFLRYVTSPSERLDVVKQAIERNWRVLSNGSF